MLKAFGRLLLALLTNFVLLFLVVAIKSAINVDDIEGVIPKTSLTGLLLCASSFGVAFLFSRHQKYAFTLVITSSLLLFMVVFGWINVTTRLGSSPLEPKRMQSGPLRHEPVLVVPMAQIFIDGEKNLFNLSSI